MSEISFTTSQNVTIDYEIASLGDRIFANIIDGLIKAGYILLLIFIAVKLENAVEFSSSFTVLAVLFVSPIVFYSLIFEMAMQGQTPGKRMRSIRVVKLDGMQPTLSAYLIRWLFRLVDFSIMSGLIAVLVYISSKKGQRLGDILAKTCVIKTKDRVQLKDTIYERINDQHDITFLEVSRLTEKDIEIIKKVLGNKEYRENFEMLFSLSQNIETKMGVKREMPQEEFLDTVVRDFNRYIGGL